MHTLHVVIEHQSDVDYSMPLRFLNYTSLLYQRLYRDRTRWSKRDTADPVLQVDADAIPCTTATAGGTRR